MEKTETLKNGKEVTIRLLTPKDLDKLVAFYRSLPPEDRKYLRVDVTDREVVAERIKLIAQGHVFRIIALAKNKIVADGALELSGEEWRKHQGEIRVIVARPYRRHGLGLIMMRELYFLAAAHNVEKVVAKMMRPQVSAKAICLKLGFTEELLIPDYVKDLSGKTQDLIIMTCDLGKLWKEVDDFYSSSDWERCR
jgi:GNAT superfamily N-acetyltransferase